MQTYALRFNWASLDGYGNSRAGQFGIGYTLLLLKKYGNEFRKPKFYFDKYLFAFPALLQDFIGNRIYKDSDFERDFTNCYSNRSLKVSRNVQSYR